MATDSSQRVIMGKTVLPLFLSCFHPILFILFILAGNKNMHGSSEEFEIQQIGPPTAELAALEDVHVMLHTFYGTNTALRFDSGSKRSIVCNQFRRLGLDVKNKHHH